MKALIYTKTDTILLIHQLDLFTECCLHCESAFLNAGNERDAALMRDCADLNVLLHQFVVRRSALDATLIKSCIESWILCLKTLTGHEQDSIFEKCYDTCQTCINEFKEYI